MGNAVLKNTEPAKGRLPKAWSLAFRQFFWWWTGGWGLGLFLAGLWLTPHSLELLSPTGALQPGLTGLYNQEQAANFNYRWTAPRWEINLPGGGSQTWLVKVEAFLEAEREVQVLYSSTPHEAGWFRPVNEWRTYTLEIPPAATPNANLALTFQSDVVPETGSLAPRELGIVIRRVTVEPVPFVPLWLVYGWGSFLYIVGLSGWAVRNNPRQLYIGLLLAASLVLWGLALWQAGTTQRKFNLGDSELSPYLTGFYAPEQNAGFGFRWSFPNWRLRLPLANVAPEGIQLRLAGLSHFDSPVQVFSSDNVLITSFTPGPHWQEYNLSIPARYLSANRLNLIFRTAGAVVDQRELGLLVTDLEVRYPTAAQGWAQIWGGLALANLAGWWLAGLYLIFFTRWAKKRLLWLFYAVLIMVAGGLPTVRPSLLYRLDALLLYAGVATILVYAWLPLANLAARLKLPALATAPAAPVVRLTLTKWQALLLAALVCVGLVARVWNLNGLSIFVDEGFHAKAALDIIERPGSTQLFALAVDGKVLHSWLLASLFWLSPPASLLLVARLFSVFCGLLTILICYKLGERLVSPTVGLMAAGLWAVLPFAIWHERQALVDPLLTTCGGLTFYFSLRALQAAKGQLFYILLTAVALTAAILTKTSAVLLLIVPGLAFGLFGGRQANRRFSFTSFTVIGLIYAVGWLLIVPLIGLYNGKWAVGQQQEKLTTALDSAALSNFTKNLLLLAESLWSYFTPILLLVAIGAGWLAWQNYRKVAWFGLVGGVLPLLILCGTVKTIYPRYFLVWLVPLMPVVAAGLLEMLRQLRKAGANQRLIVGLVVLLFLVPGWVNFQFITAPERAALPPTDRFQYVEGWPAGGNLEKLAADLQQKAARQSLTVLCVDTGTYSSLATYFYRQPGLTLELVPFGFSEKVQARAASALQNGPVYLVLVDAADFFLTNKVRASLPAYELRPVWQLARPGNAYWLVAYSLTSPA